MSKGCVIIKYVYAEGEICLGMNKIPTYINIHARVDVFRQRYLQEVVNMEMRTRY